MKTDEYFDVPPLRNRPEQQAVSITREGGELGRFPLPAVGDALPGLLRQSWNEDPSERHEHFLRRVQCICGLEEAIFAGGERSP